MSVIEPLKKVKSINIDFPFVQPADRRIDGQLATSFSTVREMIDLAIELGFNTVSFDTNVPINAQTGELQLLVVGDTNGDKTFPQAIWDGVAYAESKGLKTILDLNIRNAINDVPIMPSNVGKDFDKSVFFNTVTQYETAIAGKASQYGVDAIRIGSFNNGYDTNDYYSEWGNVIKSIRSVYKGSLGYESSLEDANNALWTLVDEIQLYTPPVSPLKSNYTKTEIAPLYLNSYTMGNGVLSQASIFSKIQSLVQKYPNKILSLEASFQPGQSAGHENADIWGWVFAEDPLLVNAKDQNSLPPYPENLIDSILNQQKIAGFFEFFGNYLKDIVSGFQYYQLAPWTETSWMRNPQNPVGQVWQSVARAGMSLNYSPESQNTIAEYLLKDWGFSTLHYGTLSNDALHGSEVADKFFTSNGNDMFSGEGGLDSLFVADNSSKYVLNKVLNTWMLGKSLPGAVFQGEDTLIGIERVSYLDKQIALDLEGNGGTTAKILGAVFGKSALNNKEYVGIGLDLLDKGMSYETLAGLALNAAKATTNDQIVTTLWTNVVGYVPSAADKAPFIKMLEDGMTPGSLAHMAADTSLNTTNINLVGLAQTGIEYITLQ